MKKWPRNFNILCAAIIAFAAFGCTKATQTEGGKDDNKEQATPTPEEFDIYLLIGQSNMAGRGPMIDSDKDTIKGVWILTPDAKIEKATNPLNKYSSVRKDLSYQEICPGFSFSMDLYARTKRPILLVVNAQGGTLIGKWKKGEELYNEAVRRTLEAKQYGAIKGILWHQGESNRTQYKSYMSVLKVIASDLRKDLGSETIPFVAGEIGSWFDDLDPANMYATNFNNMIHTISENIPYSSYASAKGCTHKGDNLHFDRASQILLGKSYSEQIYKLVYKNSSEQ